MRLAGLPALFVLFIASSAIAQSRLVQQCASYGEAQYKKLDPAFERVLPAEFPPPALERFEVKAGNQSVAAALTLRGGMAFRNRPVLETQFVCLIDAAERPLFFYALPVLAQRGAPTPIGRAAPPVPTLRRETEPGSVPRAVERMPLPPGAIPLRGLVRDISSRLMFEPCGGGPLSLEDKTPGQELTRAFHDLTAAQEGRPMFVEMYGQRDPGPGAGLSAYALRRAAVETAGCRERFDQREWIAVGNEPPWRLEITGRDLVVSVVGAALGRVPHGGVQREGAVLTYSASEGSEVRVVIDEQRCVDSSSGALYAYLVELRSEGHAYVGCAAHNPAVPAP